jgi:hypothetical protein
MILSISNKSHLNVFSNDTTRGYQDLADAFHDVLVLSTVDLPKDFASSSRDVIDCRTKACGGSYYRFIEDEALCRQLVVLKDEIVKALSLSHSRGLEDGKDLLRQLNEGSVTLKDFEEK